MPLQRWKGTLADFQVLGTIKKISACWRTKITHVLFYHPLSFRSSIAHTKLVGTHTHFVLKVYCSNACYISTPFSFTISMEKFDSKEIFIVIGFVEMFI